MAGPNVWQHILAELQAAVDPEDFQRWFATTAYASDSGDQITVWVASEGIKRHIEAHYRDALALALTGVDRRGTAIRFVVAGFGDEDDEDGPA
jgi:chromosomal replication initiation ATPase DnaA